MPTFDSHDDLSINYVDEGAGPACVLVHGFASSLQGNWQQPGIFDALLASGRRVVALDCRGHGRSAKPHDPQAYAGTAMQDDVIALIDHLGIERADLAGYSMGGVISASLLVRRPERWRSVILSGIGDGILGGMPRERASAIADAMSGERVQGAHEEIAKGFRAFAQATGNDLQALAAMQRSARARFDPSLLGAVRTPVLVLVGQGDTLVGRADKLAAAIPGAEHVVVPGDHLTAVGQPALRQAMLDFLARHSPAAKAG